MSAAAPRPGQRLFDAIDGPPRDGGSFASFHREIDKQPPEVQPVRKSEVDGKHFVHVRLGRDCSICVDDPKLALQIAAAFTDAAQRLTEAAS